MERKEENGEWIEGKNERNVAGERKREKKLKGFKKYMMGRCVLVFISN